jgi:hypothetical protein
MLLVKHTCEYVLVREHAYYNKMMGPKLYHDAHWSGAGLGLAFGID